MSKAATLTRTKQEAKGRPQFTEIARADVPGFQKIVELLTSFDEKTGRYLKYADRETHFSRVALAKGKEENVRFFVRDLGGFCYSVIGYIASAAGTLATAWVHEDGIRQERDEHSANETHPVHSIQCLTDFYERSVDVQGDHVPGIVLSLMEERV